MLSARLKVGQYDYCLVACFGKETLDLPKNTRFQKIVRSPNLMYMIFCRHLHCLTLKHEVFHAQVLLCWSSDV